MIDEMINNEINFCNEKGMQKNIHGQFIYQSTDGSDVFNLPYILNDFKEWIIENKIVKELKNDMS